MECPIDKRTSFDVFASRTPSFTYGFSIDFEFEIYPESEIGYMFRMKCGEGDKVYNLFYDGKGTGHLFMLNEEGRSSLIKAEIPRERMRERWTEIKVCMDLERDSVHLTVAGERFSAHCELPDRCSPEIFFGRSEHIIDVPSFAVRNLKIGNGSKNYVFPLDEREGGQVHDSCGRIRGAVTNPGWLINESCQWKQIAVMSLGTVAASGYSSHDRLFYYFSSDSLWTFDPAAGTVEKTAFPSRCPVDMKLGMSMADMGEDGEIYVYEPYESSDSQREASVASFDLRSLKWSVLSSDRVQMQVHHHAPFKTGREDMPFAFFGGFGNQKYNGSFYGFEKNAGKWSDFTLRLAGDRICPRYFTSAGRYGENGDIYIFGGMGNESGEQIVGRKYLYDLYRVNLEEGVTEKLWEIKLPDISMVPVRNMTVADSSHFFVLCYPESVSNSMMQLYRFSVEDGSFQTLATGIPIRSDRIATNANLYYDRQTERLYAVVQEYDDDDIKSTLKIYSVSYPPLSEETIVSGKGKNPGGGNSYNDCAVCGSGHIGHVIPEGAAQRRRTEDRRC